MTAAVSGFYVPGSGWLYRLDPRVKLWFALLGVLLAILATRLAVLLGLLAAIQAVLLAGGLHPRQIGRVWRDLSPIIGVILVLQPLLTPLSGPVLWQLGPLRITETGLAVGARYALRVSSAAFAVLVPVMTTRTATLVRAFQKVGLPYNWAMTIGLALRYLGTIGDLYATISDAQRVRGWDPSGGGPVRRARGAVPTLIALIVASLRLSDSLALGLAARGFGLGAGKPGNARQRTHLHDITLCPIDWLALTLMTAAFAGLLFLAR